VAVRFGFGEDNSWGWMMMIDRLSGRAMCWVESGWATIDEMRWLVIRCDWHFGQHVGEVAFHSVVLACLIAC
jgi:hypothetical protein